MAPIFEIQLGKQQLRLAPESVDALRTWLENEYGAWQKVHEVPIPPEGAFVGGVHAAFETLSRARSFANEASKYTGKQQETSIAAAQGAIEETFNRLRLPLSESVQGLLLREIALEDPLSAKYALYVLGVGNLNAVNFRVISPTLMRGLVQGGLISRMYGETAGDAATKLVARAEGQIAQWRSAHDKAIESVASTHSETKAALEKFNKEVQSTREAAAAVQLELRKSFDDALKAAKDSLEKFRDVITKDIALKAPSEYWRNKSRTHRHNSYSLFVCLMVLMGGMAIAVVQVFPALIPESGKDLPSYGFIVSLVILATLAFWVLRIVARLFFSQIHLAQDAQERVTMVTTYLALVETGKFETGDLAAVLNALFRNASDGIVKDEGMPMSLFEFMTRQGKT